jgi:hypothetical protein
VTPPIQPRRPIFSKLATPQQVATLFPESPELVFNQDQKAPKSFMLPVGDQSQSVRDQADRWLGSSAPKPETQDATAVAQVEPIRTPPPPVKKKTPKRNAELRKAGVSTFGKQISLADAIQSTLQQSPATPEVARIQAEHQGQEVERPDATFGESFAQGFRRQVPIPLIGGDMGATNPDPVGELAGGAAAFIPQQMVVGPAEGKILDVADQWLGKKGASDVARFIFKEGAAGSTVASAGEARALSNDEESLGQAATNVGVGAAMGPVFGAALHGGGKLLRAGDRFNENIPSHVLQGQAQREAAKGVSDAMLKTADNPLGIPDQIPTGTVNHEIRGIANDYNESAGLPPIRPFTPVEHDEPLAREISDWYEKTGSNPEDPEVQKSYDAFNRETEAQYNELVRKGWDFTPTEDAVLDAYPGAAEMRSDATKKRLKVFTGGTPNPLMTPEQNFKFRAVHDVMAHTSEGYDFDPNGEWNAALKHSQMYTPDAQRALFTETMGQNANLNYGPNGEFNRANPGKEIFPEQKAAVLPQEFADRLNAQRDASLEPTLREKLDKYEADATSRIKERRTGRLLSGFDPEDVRDEGIRLAVKLSRGALDFKDWSKDMVSRLGDSVKPHLEKIWNEGSKNWDRFQETLKKNNHTFPDDDRLEELFGKGEHGSRFYENNEQDLKEVFGDKLGNTMIRAIAATSPSSEVTSNSTLALKALKFNLLGKDLKEGFMRTHKGLLDKVFSGEPFTSQKVAAFEQNLRSDPDAVTVDVWMTRVFFGHEKPSEKQYKFIQQFVRELAKEKKVSPREMQAAIWYGIKNETDYGERLNYEHGKNPKTYAGEMRKKLGTGYLDDLFEQLPGDERLQDVRKVRDEEVDKALADNPNKAFLDRLKFRDVNNSPLVNGEKYAILTWANPHGKRYSRLANEKLNRVLLQHLQDQGFHPMKQEGKYGFKEPSFLVPGMSFEDALNFSRAGRQKGFITHEGMFDIEKGTHAPAEGVEFNNKADNYYSQIELGKGQEPIKYQMQYGKEKPTSRMELPPSLEEKARAVAYGQKFTKITGKKIASAGVPALFYTAADQEQDPKKAARLRAMGSITMALAVGSMMDKEVVEGFIREMKEKLGDVMTGGELPENIGTYGSRRYWESRFGKLDDLTWARMKQTANTSMGEKLDPLGKAFTGDGDKQYMNVAHLMQDPEGKEFIDQRVRYWEEQGLRPVKINDEATRKIANLLDVKAEDLSRSSLKAMTAPEILAVHDLMQSSQEAVRQISKFVETTPGLQKEQVDQLEEIMARHMGRFDAATLKLFEVRSEAGRALRQFKMIGEMVDTPGFWVHQAAKKMGIKMSEVPADVAEDIRHFLRNGEFPLNSKQAAKAVRNGGKTSGGEGVRRPFAGKMPKNGAGIEAGEAQIEASTPRSVRRGRLKRSPGEIHPVNLDKVPKSKRIENLDAVPLEQSPEGPSLEAQTPRGEAPG